MDFRMTQLYDLNPYHTNTMCPGTPVYMPPEALQGRPKYSEKIDCFSFGVIVLQVLTRQYPDPGDQQKRVDFNHPGMPRGQLMVCVPEVECRDNHIRLVRQVDPHNPFLPIVLDCLRDREGERPTAKQLCERVSILKHSSAYSESEKINIKKVQELQQSGEMDQTIAQLYQAIEYRDQAVAKKGEEVVQLRQQLDQAMHSHQIIQQQERTIAQKERELEQLRWQANMKEREKDQIIQQKEQIIAQKQQEVEQLAMQLRQVRAQEREKDQIITRKDQEILLLKLQAKRPDTKATEVKRDEPKVAVQQIQPVPVTKIGGQKMNSDQEDGPPNNIQNPVIKSCLLRT